MNTKKPDVYHPVFLCTRFFVLAKYGLQIIYYQQKCEYGDYNSNCKPPAVTATSTPESVFSFKISWLHKIPFFFNSLL